MKTITYIYKHKKELDELDLSKSQEAYEFVNSYYGKNKGMGITMDDGSMSDKVAINTAKHKGTFKITKAERKPQGVFRKLIFTAEV